MLSQTARMGPLAITLCPATLSSRFSLSTSASPPPPGMATLRTLLLCVIALCVLVEGGYVGRDNAGNLFLNSTQGRVFVDGMDVLREISTLRARVSQLEASATTTASTTTSTTSTTTTATTTASASNPSKTYIYVSGGRTVSLAVTTTFERFDGKTWTTMPPLPVAKSSHAMVAFRGRIYIIAGQNSTACATSVETFDGVSWGVAPSLQRGRFGHGASVYLDSIIVAGGYINFTGNARTETAERFDGARWVMISALSARRSYVSMFGALVIGGGEDSATVTTVQEYRINNTWAFGPSIPSSRDSIGLAFYNGRLYAVGGFVGGGVSTVDVYDGISWTTGRSLLTARENAGVVAYEGLLYALGGGPINAPLATTEFYDGLVWSPGLNLTSPRTRSAAVVF